MLNNLALTGLLYQTNIHLSWLLSWQGYSSIWNCTILGTIRSLVYMSLFRTVQFSGSKWVHLQSGTKWIQFGKIPCKQVERFQIDSDKKRGKNCFVFLSMVFLQAVRRIKLLHSFTVAPCKHKPYLYQNGTIPNGTVPTNLCKHSLSCTQLQQPAFINQLHCARARNSRQEWCIGLLQISKFSTSCCFNNKNHVMKIAWVSPLTTTSCVFVGSNNPKVPLFA